MALFTAKPLPGNHLTFDFNYIYLHFMFIFVLNI